MQTIYLDISNKGVVPTIYAKQGEVGRKFTAVLTDAGVPYVLDESDLLSAWYEGTSGIGNYTTVGENSAFTVDGNKVTIELITQMLTNDGGGVLSVSINKTDGSEIATWNIPYLVEKKPGIDSPEAETFYTAFSEIAGQVADSANRAEAAAENLENITPESIGATTPAYVKKANPVNLLDNSYFRNPVNQRGFTSISNSDAGITYVADRWEWWNVAGGTHNVTLTKGVGLVIGAKSATTRLLQRINNDIFDSTKTYTAFCKLSDGTLLKGSVDNTTLGGNTYSALFDVPANVTVIWAVMYEGEYTAANLPEYHPKGYAHELMECQRYFERIGRSGDTTFFGQAFYLPSGSVGAKIFVPFTTKKRIDVPTCTVSDKSQYRLRTYHASDASSLGATPLNGISATSVESTGVMLHINFPSVSGNFIGILQRNDGSSSAVIDISADL